MRPDRLAWLVIADDLTGACDTGGAFSHAWQSVKVVLDPGQALPQADVLVLNSESRSLKEAEAAAVVAGLLKSTGISPTCRVYKKIDSTLRGNPWAELEAVMRELQVDRALVAPAFPEQGRTVSQGVLRVHGVPIAETVFAQQSSGWVEGLADRAAPFHLLSIEVVRQGGEPPSRWLAEAGPGLMLADAETPEDLRALARAFVDSGLRLACGSAGLARALAAETGKGKVVQRRPEHPGPALVIAGSRHPQTVKQVARLRQSGIAVFEPGWEEIRIANQREEMAGIIARVLEQSQPAVIASSALAYVRGQEQQVAAGLARLALCVMERFPAGGLALTGGDIAAMVCRTLGCGVIDLGGDILPGMPWGRLEGGRYPGQMVVTKAGGFGDDDALLAAVRWLSGQVD